MDALENVFKEKNVNYVRIDGSTPNSNREKLIAKFQNQESKIALLSLTACSTGLNLTIADTVIFAELYWVPGVLLQAQNRVHRLGSKHSCIHIYYIVANNTIDESIWSVINKKSMGVNFLLDRSYDSLTSVCRTLDGRDRDSNNLFN